MYFVHTELSWSPASEKDLGEVKLSISYKNDKLFIMVMHIRGLVSVCVYSDTRMFSVLLRPAHFSVGSDTRVDLTFHVRHGRNPFAPHLTACANNALLLSGGETFDNRVEVVCFGKGDTSVTVVKVSARVKRVNNGMSILDGTLSYACAAFPEMHHGVFI